MTEINSTEQDNKAYRFFAYISSSYHDRKIVMKLEQQLGMYQLPQSLRNELEQRTGKRYPVRIYPLFCERVDLFLDGQLPFLETSKYLIVVCTPSSAQSTWVNQEIEHFILMGQYERIILYIVDGKPNSNDPSTECLPPILRRNREYLTYSDMTPEQNTQRQEKLHALLEGTGELKGISVKDDSAKIANLKVIIKLLEIDPDLFWVHEGYRRRKNICRRLGIVFLFILCFVLSCFFIWNRCYRVSVGYYADYVEKWGVPEGIFPLTKDQTAQKSDHYRIYKRNQQVQRLEHVNSVGTPIPVTNTEFINRPTIAVYSIYKDGRLVQRDTLDNNGNVVLSYQYAGDNMQKVTFIRKNTDGTNSIESISNLTSISQSFNNQDGQKNNIGGMSLIRDEQGRVVEVRFLKERYDVPTTDEQGVAGFRYKRDETGRVVEKVYVNMDRQPQSDKYGVARRTNQYDNYGNLVEAKYYDQNGQLTSNELGWACRKNTFDKNGNVISEEFFDKNGNPCLCNDSYMKVLFKYDERGNCIEQAYYGIDGKPCLNKDNIAGWKAVYNGQNQRTHVVFFDKEGKTIIKE